MKFCISNMLFYFDIHTNDKPHFVMLTWFFVWSGDTSSDRFLTMEIDNSNTSKSKSDVICDSSVYKSKPSFVLQVCAWFQFDQCVTNMNLSIFDHKFE